MASAGACLRSAATTVAPSRKRSRPSAPAIWPPGRCPICPAANASGCCWRRRLIGQPKLLLLDEPLISLDARHQEVAIDVVRKVCRERGITVLFSAHELNQLLGTLDRVLYLGNGQAVLGTVDEVITAPVLSRLYGTEIQVVRADGHIFVMSRGRDVERSDHLHDHGTATAITSHITITDMFAYEFMNNAFAAAGIVAVVSGIVGYFLVMRGQTFAGHALSHIGFAGATGAGLIGLAPLWGLLGFTLAAGIVMGVLSERISNRDVAIGVVLALALGFGLVVPALLHVVRHAGDRAAVRQRAGGRPHDDRDAGRARRRHAGRAGGDHAAADLRESAAGTGGSQGRAAALRLDRVPRHRRAGGIGLRADRRRACWCSR